MFQHMIEAQILDLVVGSMYLLVGIFHLCFSRHSRRITVFTCRGVVGAGISALGLQVTHRTVLMQLVSLFVENSFPAGRL
jgi:hypothetical protein